MYTFWCVYIPRLYLIYFVLAILIGAHFYPGGNHLDASQEGYSYTLNFLSELGFYNTLSGENNFISSFFFNSAMYINLILGLGFLFIPKLFSDNLYASIFSWVGAITIAISCVFFAGVGLTPGDLYFPAHVFSVQTAFNLSFLAYLFICLAFFFSTSSNKYTIACILMFIVSVGYAFHISGQPIIDPVNEKELFYETVSLEMLRLNVILQKVVVLLMNISLLMFSFGFADRIKRRGL